jgi:hypothetical protein
MLDGLGSLRFTIRVARREAYGLGVRCPRAGAVTRVLTLDSEKLNTSRTEAWGPHVG